MISIYLLIFFLGACIASFLQVYSDRTDKRSAVFGNSMCQSCLRRLNFYELVPIVSFIFLKGRCRTCKARIPNSLFYGEIILGAWFLGSFLYAATLPLFFLLTLFGSVFYLLVIEDLKQMQVSSRYLYFFVSLGIVIGLYRFAYTHNVYELFIPLLIFSPFWLIYFVNKNYIGEADPYIFTSLGLSFGMQFSLSLFLYSVWLGAIYGISYLYFVNKKFERNVRIPFIPIIFLASLFILIFNWNIIKITDILFLYEFYALK
jgi:prepilin signal peptidase PulO-like enzyme (type II secretory pathway)